MKNRDYIFGLLLGLSIGLLSCKVIDTINDVIVKIEMIKQQGNEKR